MKALKIAAIVTLVLWMGWVSKELMDIRLIAIETCGLVTSKMADGAIHTPVVCPDLTSSEAKRANSN
jgi:hypothetical protein